ncbi:MAG: hypothetical protein AAF916_11390 [Planctomycetota bacterium]
MSSPAVAVAVESTPLTALERDCQRRGELFARCFSQYAEAMHQMTDALDRYESVLRDGPRWARST